MSESIESQVTALVRDAMPALVGADDVTGGARLEEDLGFDSVGLVDLLCTCEEHFGIDLPADDLMLEGEAGLTVDALVGLVQRRLG